MSPPSTSWKEDVSPDEAKLHEEYAQVIVDLQKQKTEKFGVGRTLHRKGLLPIKARLEVLPNLPAHAAHGLFATPATFDAWVRLSNGAADKQRDKVPDIRGFAIKVLGVSGEGALGGPAKSQDFLLINRPAFSSPKTDEFINIVRDLRKGQGALLLGLFKRHGFKAFAEAKRLIGGLKRPFSGFSTETFWSAAPIACGPYACRVRLLPASTQTSPTAQDDWAEDVKSRLAKGPLVHELQLQFFTDEKTTPIEDASKDWPETEAPYVTVARLTLQQQSLDPAHAEEVEKAVFDPWSALKEHRPLGEVMRARKVAYFASGKARGAF